MNVTLYRDEDRLLQLLADHATEGLDARGMFDLDRLLASQRTLAKGHFEPAAAALDLGLAPADSVTVPAGLRERILHDAQRMFRPEAVHTATPAKASGLGGPAFDAVARSRGGRIGWFAAAAMFLLAAVGWYQVFSSRDASTGAADRYARFVREVEDAVHAPWKGEVEGYRFVAGEAVWSDSRQHGFLRLIGLPPNDADRAQYQLWIVDANRDKHPVDGGVFDVPTSGEIIVPIDAKLTVHEPSVFAITLEKPGGVVVSSGPLLVVGSVNG